MGIPYPALPVAIAQHQLPRPAARRVLFDPTLFPGDSAVAMGVGSPSGSGTAEEAAVAWLDTVCSRPPAGFAATKQVPVALAMFCLNVAFCCCAVWRVILIG